MKDKTIKSQLSKTFLFWEFEMVKSYWLTEAGGDLAGDRNSEVKTASAYSPIMLSNSSATSARASDSNSSARLWGNNQEINVKRALWRVFVSALFWLMMHKPVLRALIIINWT